MCKARITVLILATLILVLWIEKAVAASPTSPSKVVEMRQYGFSLRSPPRWHVALDKDDLPIFVNFPWAKMQPQLRLPAKGAVINVVALAKLPRRRGDESLAGWSHMDDVRAAPGTILSETLRLPAVTEISEAVLVSFDEATYGPDDQAQREVSIYWVYRGDKFAAHLFYLVGDPQGSSYENLLKQIVVSLRPL